MPVQERRATQAPVSRGTPTSDADGLPNLIALQKVLDGGCVVW